MSVKKFSYSGQFILGLRRSGTAWIIDKIGLSRIYYGRFNEKNDREEEAMMNRMQEQESNMRRRQEENNLFMQAQELNSMLDQQEATMNNRGPGGQGGPGGQDSPWGTMRGGPGPAWDDRGNMDNGSPFGGGNQGGGFGRGPGGPRGGHRGGPDGPWGGDRGGPKRGRFN